jgi:hypothetical protein
VSTESNLKVLDTISGSTGRRSPGVGPAGATDGMPRSPSLVPELPRTPDIPAERGPGAWERHRARLKAAGGQAQLHLEKMASTLRPAPQPVEEDPSDVAARNAKAALMSMSDAMDGGSYSEWGTFDMSELAAPPAQLSPQARVARCESTMPPVPFRSHLPVDSTGTRPVSAGRHSPTHTSVVPSVHERLASQSLSRGEYPSDVARRRRRSHEARSSVSKSTGRNDPVLAWGYSPNRRGGRVSPAGSSASSISHGPSSPGATECDRRSPPPEPMDERARMAVFAGDEALAMGRHDAAIAKFEDALSYCVPHSAGFLKLQQRLLHATRVQSEVRRVVADWVRTHERPSSTSPVSGTLDADRRSALLQRRMEAATSPLFSGPASGLVQPVVQHGSPIATQKIYRPRAQRKTMAHRGSPFEVPKKDTSRTKEIPAHSRDNAFPARMPGAVASRTAMRRPQRAALKSR